MALNDLVNIQLGRKLSNDSVLIHQGLDDTIANIIGTSYKGPAFVPQSLTSIKETNAPDEDGVLQNTAVANTQINVLGSDRQNRISHYYDFYTSNCDSTAFDTASSWLLNGGDFCSFTRVLGAGEGVLRSDTQKLQGAGFNASNNISSGTLDHTRSRYLNANENGDPGSVCFMFKQITSASKRNGVGPNNIDVSTVDYLNELGLDDNTNILTDVVIFASGVMPDLSNSIGNPGTNFDTNPGTFENISTNNANFGNYFLDLKGYSPRFKQKVDNSDNIIQLNNYFDEPNDEGIQNLIQYTKKIKVGTTTSNNTNDLIENSKPLTLVSNDKNYFSNMFWERGHMFYATFPITGLSNQVNNMKFLSTKSFSTFAEQQQALLPDYNSWECQFTTAKTPWVTSQPLDRTNFGIPLNGTDNRANIHEKVSNLFRFWSLDDGEVGNRFRIKINITSRGDISNDGQKDVITYAKFDLYIFEYDSRANVFCNLSDDNTLASTEPVETYLNLDLNPNSKDYIARRIGTKHTHYDFKANKIITKGFFDNKSMYVRVEIDNKIEEMFYERQYNLLPSGFRSYPHIEFQKDAFLHYAEEGQNKGINLNDMFDTQGVKQLPPLYNLNYFEDNFCSSLNSIQNNWGVSFSLTSTRENNAQQNKFLINNFALSTIVEGRNSITAMGDYFKSISPHYFYSKYFMSGIQGEKENLNVWKEEDNYLNSFFHLEKIYFQKNAEGDDLHQDCFSEDNKSFVRYKHSGRNIPAGLKEYIDLDDNIFWSPDKTLNPLIKDKISFDFFTYGGFDGVDIRDFDKKRLNNDAIIRELNDPLETLSTTKSYEKAIDIATDYSNCDGDILVVPGIKEERIVRKCIQICEDDKRHFFITDISGAASNTTVSFDDQRDLDIDNDGNFGEAGEEIADFALITSKGIMGSNFILDRSLANYTRNLSNIIEDKRFILTDADNPEVGDVKSYYSYKSLLQKQYEQTIQSWNNFDITSRYVLPLLGELTTPSEKHIKPETFVLGLMAASPNKRTSLSAITTQPSLLEQSVNYALIDNVSLSSTSPNFQDKADDLKKSSINILYKGTDPNQGILLNSNTVPYPNRKSVFRDQGVVRAIQEIKKRLKFDLFVNDSFIEGGFFFTQNSNSNNLYSRLDIQLNNIMSSFVEEGLITAYAINLPDLDDDQTFIDMQNYTLRGNIVLQINNSDKIKLDIDNILGDLSVLQGSLADTVLVPSI